jgi:hypothetical protein
MILRPSIILSMLRCLRSFDLPRLIFYFPIDHRCCTQAIISAILAINDKHMLPIKHFPIEECTYFWGVNTSWGINTTESKRPLNQEDNQAPQPTVSPSRSIEKMLIFPTYEHSRTLLIEQHANLSQPSYGVAYEN